MVLVIRKDAPLALPFLMEGLNVVEIIMLKSIKIKTKKSQIMRIK